MMATELTDMTIGEISLVDEPANDHSRVVIVKAKKMPPWLKDKVDAEDAADGNDDETAEEKKKRLARKVGKHLRAALTEAGPALIAKAMAGFDDDDEEARNLAETSITETIMDLDTLTAALETANDQITALTKRAGDAEAALQTEIAKAKPAATEEDFLKSLPPAARERLVAAETAAKTLTEAAELAGAIAKAKSFGFGSPDKLGPLLVRMTKGATTPEDATEIETLLKQAAMAEKHSTLFKGLGVTAAVEGSASAMLDAKAVEIQKSREGLTKEQAYAAALAANPDLYDAYVSERRQQH